MVGLLTSRSLLDCQLLELKREEFAKRMAECDSRQSELKKKCKDLRKRVQTKEQEVQETRSKIDRATKKQAEEQGFQASIPAPVLECRIVSELLLFCFVAAKRRRDRGEASQSAAGRG